MKNKILALTLITITALSLASCASSRSKYGCPSTAYQAKVSVKS